MEDQIYPTEPNQETIDRFFSAYATYLQAFQPAWMAPELQQDGAAAYQTYAQALQELMELDLRKRAMEAWNAYLAVIERTLSTEEMQANLRQAFQNYLHSVQQAWAENDLQGVNALTLAAISQSLSMASWLAAASTGVASKLSEGPTQSITSV